MMIFSVSDTSSSGMRCLHLSPCVLDTKTLPNCQCCMRRTVIQPCSYTTSAAYELRNSLSSDSVTERRTRRYCGICWVCSARCIHTESCEQLSILLPEREMGLGFKSSARAIGIRECHSRDLTCRWGMCMIDMRASCSH